MRTLRCLSPLALACLIPAALASIVSFDFDAEPDGMDYQGTAAAVTDGVLRVTPLEPGQETVAILPELPELAPATDGFTATFMLRVWGTDDDRDDQPWLGRADGLAFNFSDPDSGLISDPDNNDFAEGGFATGLSVTIDEWDTDGDGHSVVKVRTDGTLRGVFSVGEYTADEESRRVTVNYSPLGGLSVEVTRLDDDFEPVTPGPLFTLTPDELGGPALDNAYRFAFTGRTGGGWAYHDVDDLTIQSPVIPEPRHYAALAGAALLGFAAWRRARR
jgi:hypothetical protein